MLWAVKIAVMDAELAPSKKGEHNSESASTLGRGLTPLIMIWDRSMVERRTRNRESLGSIRANSCREYKFLTSYLA